MEKDNLKLYVDLMNRYDEETKLGMTMVFNSDEKNLLSYMKKIAIKDKEANKFLNSLTTMSPEEREQAVEDYFKEEDKDIIITLDDVKDYKEEIANKSKEDQNKLNYLINNYNKLKIKGIWLSDLKYIDENDEVKDIDLKKIAKEEEKEEIKEYKSRTDRNYDELKDIDEEDEEIILPVKKETTKSTKKPVKKENTKAEYFKASALFLSTALVGVVLAIVALLFIKK